MTYPAGWPRCRCGQPVVDGHITCGNVVCGPESDAAALRVGDVVSVTRPCLDNAAHARAVVIECYTLDARPGWTLLFANGAADGFSPSDCLLFGVVRVDHEPALASYVFRGMSWLQRDVRDGRFSAIWSS